MVPWGSLTADEPIIGPTTKHAMVQWAIKRLTPATRAACGRDDLTTYTLRHSHASALHYAGYTVPSAARRLGHSPAVHIGYYAHVIDALEGKPHHDDLDALIAAARAELKDPARALRNPGVT
jgi:integrase